jgi:hypothetical protein
MLRRVALVRTDVSEELNASFIKATRSNELGTTLAITSNQRAQERMSGLVNDNVPSSLILSTLMIEAILSFETSVSTIPTRCHIPNDGIHHIYRREDIKSYITLTGLALYRIRNVFNIRYELDFYIPEDCILHSHRREYLKSYIALTGWAL